MQSRSDLYMDCLSLFVISRSAVRIRQVAQIIFRRENNSAGIIRRGPHFPVFPQRSTNKCAVYWIRSRQGHMPLSEFEIDMNRKQIWI